MKCVTGGHLEIKSKQIVKLILISNARASFEFEVGKKNKIMRLVLL